MADELPRPRKVIRWLKRICWMLVVLILTMAVFHRPLLRMAAKWGAGYFAAKAGYQLEWELQGDLLSDISIQRLHLTGNDKSVLKSLDVGAASSSYGLWELVSKGPATFLHSVSLRDAHAVVDLRERPRVKKEKLAKAATQPADYWLSDIELRNISAQILTDEGESVLDGLTLVLKDDTTGEFAIGDFKTPSGQVHLNGVRGETQVKDRTIAFKNVEVAQGLRVPNLEVDLSRLSQGAVTVKLSAQSGGATIGSEGSITSLWSSPELNLSLVLHGVSQDEVGRWVKLPAGLKWRIDEAQMEVKGPPGVPQKLHAALTARATTIEASGLRAEALDVKAQLNAGILRLESAYLRSGSNSIQLKGMAKLPVAWGQIRTTSADVTWEVNAPLMEAFFSNPSRFAGEVVSNGAAHLKEGRFDGAEGTVEATNLKVGPRAIASVKASVATDARTTHLQSALVKLDDQNQASIHGDVALDGNQSANLSWEFNAGDLAAFVQWLAIDNLQVPEAGRLTAKGTAAFPLAEVTAHKYSNIDASATAQLDGLLWQGRRLEKAVLNGSLKQEVVELTSLQLQMDKASTATVTGSLGLAGNQPARLVWKAESKDLAATAVLAGLKDESLPSSGSLVTEGEASANLAELRSKDFSHAAAKGRAAIHSLQWRKGHLDSATAEFELRENEVRLPQVSLLFDPNNKVRASMQLNLTGNLPGKLAWNVELRDLGAIASWIDLKGTPPPSAGTLLSSGEASGSMQELRGKDYAHATGKGLLSISALQWQKGRLDSILGELELRDGRAELQKLNVQFDPENTIAIQGKLATGAAGEFEGSVIGKLNDLPALSGWLELAKAPGIRSGKASVLWNGKGELATGSVTGSGSIDVADVRRTGSDDVYALALEAKHEGMRSEISRLLLTAGDLRASASAFLTETDLKVPQLSVVSGDLKLVEGAADIPLLMGQGSPPVDPGRPLSVTFHVDKLNVEKLLKVFKQKPAAQGVISADVDLYGLLPELTGKVAFSAQNIRATATGSKLDPASVQLDAVLAGNRVNLSAAVRQAPLQPLTAKAEMPLNVAEVLKNPGSLLDLPIEASASLPHSDLAPLQQFVPAIDELQGTAGMDMRVQGTLRTPELAGHAFFDVPNAELRNGQMSIRDLKIRSSLAGQRITVDEIAATLSGGHIRGGGTVDLAPLTDPKIDVHVDAEEALIVRDDTMSLRTNGHVSCVGTLSKAELKGSMELVRGRIFKEIEFLPLSLPNHLPPPPPPAAARSTAAPSLPPPFDQWTFDVTVVTRDQVRLLGNVLNGGAIANLRATGTGAAPVVEGKVSLEGAHVRLPFSKLTVSRGDITFPKENPLDPQLDLQGESLVNNYVVNVRAYGSALAPKLALSSSPPLKENEIVTLLATGSTSGDGTSAQGEAANRAAFLLASQLYRKALGKAAPKRYDDEPPKLTFSFSPLTTGSSQRGVSATYEISPKLQAVGTVGDQGFRGLLHYLVRFR